MGECGRVRSFAVCLGSRMIPFHSCTHTHVYTHTHTHTHTYTYTCTHIRAHTPKHTQTYTHALTRTYSHAHCARTRRGHGCSNAGLTAGGDRLRPRFTFFLSFRIPENVCPKVSITDTQASCACSGARSPGYRSSPIGHGLHLQ